MTGDPCQDLWHGLYCMNGRVLNISLYDNNLSGSLPAGLAKADALQVLNLTLNLIGGNIPTEILSMKSLQHLELQSNYYLTGKLPDVLSLPNLTTLELGFNSLDGSLLTKWDTPQLQVLDLSANQFTGSLPESISGLKNLKYLHLEYNNLTGTFPSSWGNLANLQSMWLSTNSIDTPSIPSSWRGMKRMEEIQLDNMTGSVPSWIGSSWPQLQVLFLWDGSLTGELPTSLCDLKQLEQIGLNKNSLTGEIPTCLCELTTLEYVGLSDNKLTGSIPDCIGHIMDNLYALLVGGNNLTGTLPDSLGDLSLDYLDVSRNGLYGAIPSSFSNLTNMEGYFFPYNNKFSTFGDGLEDFFKFIPSCSLEGNPWSCPMPIATFLRNVVHNAPNATQGTSMTTAARVWRTVPVGGIYNEGPNCLEDSSSGPDTIYRCNPEDWTYGSSSQCPYSMYCCIH